MSSNTPAQATIPVYRLVPFPGRGPLRRGTIDMVPDLSHTETPPQLQRAKYRMRFRKDGDLRLVSHHDLMHCFERMFRRAELPFAQSQGYHPHPRMTFAQALALGTAGAAEVFEFELTTPLAAEEVHTRLRSHAPAGLDIVTTSAIDPKQRANVRRAFYRLPIFEIAPIDLPQRCQDLLARDEAWIERTRPHKRRFNLRPFLNQVFVEDGHLHVVLWITSHGSARPEEVAELLGLQNLLEQGVWFDRTFLELEDEVPEAEREPLPQALVDLVPKVAAPKETKIKTVKPKALMDNPMSFET